MALETHNYYYTGNKTVTKRKFSGSISVTTEDDRPKLRDKVFVSSVRGNRVSPNPYVLSFAKVSQPYGMNTMDSVDSLTGTYAFTHEDGFVGFRELSYSIPTNTSYNKTLSRFNEKVRGEIDLTIETAQSPSTIRMIKGCTSVERYATSRDWRSWIGKSSERWLEYQYGYKPLLQTIYDSIDEFLGFTKNLTKVITASSSERWSISPTAGFMNYGNLVSSAPLKGMSRSRISCILSDVQGRDTPRYLSYDPSILIWETIPYSFVVDWFYNVSGFLRDQETAYLYQKRFVSGYVSSSHKVDGSMSFIGSYSRNTDWRTKSTYTVSATARLVDGSHTRSVLNNYPSPNLPHFKVDLGWQRLLSAAALIGVQTPRKPGKR